MKVSLQLKLVENKNTFLELSRAKSLTVKLTINVQIEVLWYDIISFKVYKTASIVIEKAKILLY